MAADIDGASAHLRITPSHRHGCREGAVNAKHNTLGQRRHHSHIAVHRCVIAAHHHLDRIDAIAQ